MMKMREKLMRGFVCVFCMSAGLLLFVETSYAGEKYGYVELARVFNSYEKTI